MYYLAEMTTVQTPLGKGELFELVLFGAGIVLTLGIAGVFLVLLTRKDSSRTSSGTKDSGGAAADHDSTNG